MRTPSRLFLGYLVVESAALVALIMTIGVGPTLLAYTAAFIAGLLLAGAQLRRQLGLLLAGRRDGALREGALVALGTLLVVIPGLVSTALGLLMLLPATRRAVRSLLATVTPAAASRPGEVIDGEVIDGEVIDVVDAPTP